MSSNRPRSGGVSCLELLSWAQAELKDAGVMNPRPDCEVLLCAAIKAGREELYRDLSRSVTLEEAESFKQMVALRRRRCPVPYIIGEREFWSLSFHVDPRVLIPRHETELVVEAALCYAPRHKPIAEVGTGSGCIAVSVASELEGCRITATDSSAEALEVARENVRRHGFHGRIELICADLFPETQQRYGAVLSNPPYVAGNDWSGLMPEITQYEPRQALVPGPTGLELFPSLAQTAAQVLCTGGVLILEFGAGQERDVARIVSGAGLNVTRTMADMAGLPRVIVATKG